MDFPDYPCCSIAPSVNTEFSRQDAKVAKETEGLLGIDFLQLLSSFFFFLGGFASWRGNPFSFPVGRQL